MHFLSARVTTSRIFNKCQVAMMQDSEVPRGVQRRKDGSLLRLAFTFVPSTPLQNLIHVLRN